MLLCMLAVPKNQSIHSLWTHSGQSQCVWFFVGKKFMPHLPGAAAGSVTASAASGRWISVAQAKKASGSPTVYFMMTLGPPWMNRGQFLVLNWIEDRSSGRMMLVTRFDLLGNTQRNTPPNNLTYPTLGKGKSSFWRVPFFCGIC